MAWKKITISEGDDLHCDILNEDINAAVKELKHQLNNAGILPGKPVRGRNLCNAYSSGYTHIGLMRIRNKKNSSGRKPSKKEHKISLSQRKRANKLV